ncbi:MAG TPA: hypothetical protein VF743_10815, partial [Acidimicrobiales bacterium]
MTYLALPRPSANRVYGAAAPSLLGAELRFMAAALFGDLVADDRVVRLGGVDYVELEVRGGDGHLGADELAVLSNASGLYALFERRGDDHLRPVEVTPLRRHDDDVVTIQRYAGKTNEQFTHLLVNVTLAAAGDAFRRALDGGAVTLLDPLAGRGTTLNQAVLYGLDCWGVEA